MFSAYLQKSFCLGKYCLTIKLFVIFSGYNYPSAAETLCWLTNLYLCWRHFNSLKSLPESQHLFSPGKRDSKLWTVLTLYFMLTPLAKILKLCWKLGASVLFDFIPFCLVAQIPQEGWRLPQPQLCLLSGI